MAQQQAYTLSDILISDLFFENVMRAAEMSRERSEHPFTSGALLLNPLFKKIIDAPRKDSEGCESSFGVYDNQGTYRITRPFKEEKDLCGSKVLGSEGFGLYLPPEMQRVLSLHFHPLDHLAAPSGKDLEMELLESHENKHYAQKNKKRLFHQPIAVVGHASVVTTLFFGQWLPSSGANVEDVDALRYLAVEIVLSSQANEGSLNISDPSLSYQIAERFKATGKYLAEVIAFKDRSKYDQEIRRVLDSGFIMLQPL